MTMNMTMTSSPVPQRGSGPVRARHCVSASGGTVLRGRLPCGLDSPVLSRAGTGAGIGTGMGGRGA